MISLHFGPMTNDEIDQVERLVNEEIWKGIDVNIQEMDIASAKWAQWPY